jgi:hypothetical protein
MNTKTIIEKLIFPDYDEGTFLYISLTLICLLLANYNYFIEAIKLLLVGDNQSIILSILSIPYILIIIDALYNAFSKRRKTNYEIACLLLLTIVVNLHINILAISYFYDHQLYFHIIFPAINLIHVFWILVIFRYGYLNDTERILDYFVSDEELDFKQAIIGTIITLSLFYILYYYLHYNWSATLSLCISYTVIFNKIVIALLKDIKKLFSHK